MAAKQNTQQGGGVITSRSKDFFYGSPSHLGYSHLIDPDDAFGERKFKGNFHFGEASKEALEKRLDQAIDALWPQFLKEAKEKGKDPSKLKKPTASDWLDDHYKEAKENWKIKTDYLQFANDAEYEDRKTREVKLKTMKAWDAQGNLKDLKSLKVGMGSIVKPVLQLGIWMSPMQKQPALSFKLQGIQILKLEQYNGASTQQAEEVSQEDLDLLGDVDITDLTGFGASGGSQTQSQSEGDKYDDEFEDDIPF